MAHAAAARREHRVNRSPGGSLVAGRDPREPSRAEAAMPRGPKRGARMAAPGVASRRTFDSGQGSGGARREQALDGAQVLLRVHPDGSLVGLDDADGDAVLQEAQLLELLGQFEGRRR